MANYVEIDSVTGRIVQVKFGGTEPIWPTGRRGFSLDPNNDNHDIKFGSGFYYTCDENNVFTKHAVPDNG